MKVVGRGTESVAEGWRAERATCTQESYCERIKLLQNIASIAHLLTELKTIFLFSPPWIDPSDSIALWVMEVEGLAFWKEPI